MRYSLSDYKLSITLPAAFSTAIGLEKFSIGGEGSYLGSIAVSQTNDTFTTEADSTGSWYHNKNLARNGTVTIEINQLADSIVRLKRVFNLYFNVDDYDGMTMVLTDRQNNVVSTMEDCFIQKPADQTFGETAATQSWVLTCGRITFN